MLIYAKIIDTERGLCNVACGNNEQYYLANGFTKKEVQQSDIDNNWYLIDKCPMKTDEVKALEEKNRVYNLSITKYDFLKYVCKPYGITYTMLNEFINSNEEILEAWMLCSRVYRGNELLCNNISYFIPNLTETKLDEIFKTYGE